MSLVKLIDFNILGDERGKLISLEGNKNIPFDIKRVYYIFGTRPDVARGFHAHKELKQVLFAVKGNCRIVLDDGSKKEDIILDKPQKGIFIDSFIWREMHDFSEDCVLMVLASEHYNELDYVRKYDDFLKKTKS
ncbi:FdtA/QdtA family cupin domain-containing protein [Xenorhabdus bovienii]|uniref:sugar 3,4-ketoisomerase n=1 Tax=Xenorhabdus bovienii TaxID=40576 RepID=UPI0023B269DE|nr:FdtA/QdtA family cupin domain-containing protein [Xenorhabdus bovienii]MDE9444689.1 FdtA/QdtA family cupin domain-containing protein [Xenorhabdus bovienii]